MTRPDNYEPNRCCDHCAHATTIRVTGSHLEGLGCFLGEQHPNKRFVAVDDEGWRARRVFGTGVCPSFSSLHLRSPAE